MRILLLLTILSISFKFFGQNTLSQKDSLTKSLILKSIISTKRDKSTDLSKLDFNIINEINDSETGSKLVYVCQKINGIEIFNAISTFHINRELVQFSTNRFKTKLQIPDVKQTPKYTPSDVYKIALNYFGLDTTIKLNYISDSTNGSLLFKINQNERISFKLYYLHENETLSLVWKFNIKDLKNNHWWEVCIDAITGNVLFKKDMVLNCHFFSKNKSEHSDFKESISVIENGTDIGQSSSKKPAYLVFPLPYESPLYTSRVLTYNPFDTQFSPNGWHDLIGQNGNENRTTKGNNVYAYEDSDANDAPNSTPISDTNLVFNFEYDKTKSPSSYRDAAITQLFYVNNMIHDITYSYGFDEESGNFQNINFSNKGKGNDAVNAEGQDGSGSNNANFATPPDGENPRMQMYIFNTKSASQLLTIESPISLKTGYYALIANFGPTVFSNLSNKELVLYNDNISPDPNDACESPINGADFQNKIVLIKRGNCKFYNKVKNAQDNGALAVVVINNSDTPIVSMSGTDDPSLDQLITIPSIMISLADGNELINNLKTNKLTATLSPPQQSTSKDSDFDNGIIIHEYTHGISNRLTGGPSNTSCLYNDEQMGEGWSDYFALMLTLKSNDFKKDYRAMGLFAVGQDTVSGRGIRPAPYSTNLKINPYTYNDIKDSIKISMPHGIGFIWSSILWDMTSAFVNKYGYDKDLINGKGGNNKALKLVTYAMKLQPCNPGFVDGRDAILLADEILFKGENKYLIWCTFARRGVGFSASQGSSNDRFDQIAAFDLPNSIELNISSCGPYFCSIDGNKYTQSGKYTITSTGECTISHILNVTINRAIDNSVEMLEGNLYKSNAQNFKYQWLDCNNSLKPLMGEVRQFFKPTKSGNYAVRVYNEACADTSSCFIFLALGVVNEDFKNELAIFPNPSNGVFQLQFKNDVLNSKVTVIDISGKKVFENNFMNTNKIELNLDLEAGTYQIEISGNNYISRNKIFIVR